MNIKPLIAISAVAAISACASAQQTSSSSPGIAVSAGIYLPSSAQIRNDLGNQGLQFGLGGSANGRPSDGSITPQYTLIIDNGKGNQLFILPFTYGYEYHFGAETDASMLPYVRPFLGVAFFDYSITDFASGQHTGVKQLGGTYGLEAGILFGTKIKLSAAYNYFTQSSGFSFNGLTLAATYTLFNL
jgi:hypothetical protein